MNRSNLKSYAPQARRDFIEAVTDRAAYYGLTAKKIEPMVETGDVAIIGDRAVSRAVASKRKRLEQRIKRDGFHQVMEAMAYTWFNRFVAIRYMEIHGYLEHGYRVLSHPEGNASPEIVEHAEDLELPGLDLERVIELKLEGTKESELYRTLLIAHCNALSNAMPFLFERIDDETELLLPENLLHSDSLIRTLVAAIPEEDWKEVEIIGWLYQFYISEKKDEVIGKVVKSEDIPAATQLFTPNWVVKYLVQNSLGQQWVATYPNSSLKQHAEYYIDSDEQTPEVEARLKKITPASINPEELTLLDPACGSGHILVEAYDLLKGIYQERGYRAKDIPRLILEKNLFGLEIDDRAAQLAAFALMMKARFDDRRIVEKGVQLNVFSIQESKGLNVKEITKALNRPISRGKPPPDRELFEEVPAEKSTLFSGKTMSVEGDISESSVASLIDLFEHGKTLGSLIKVPKDLAEKMHTIAERVADVITHGGMLEQAEARLMMPLVDQARMLGSTYTVVVTNPPYMGGKYLQGYLKNFVANEYPDGKGDLYSSFFLRNLYFARASGSVAMITIPNWMFLSTFESFREAFLNRTTVLSFIHNGRGVWGADFGSCAFVVKNTDLPAYRGKYRRLFDKNSHVATNEELRRRFFETSDFAVAESEFDKIPGSPIAYWISPQVRDSFGNNSAIAEIADAKQGLATADNNRFLRFWYEVDISRIRFGCTSRLEAVESNARWFPYNKGGQFRRWFGNYEYVVDWADEGASLAAFEKAVVRNPDYYFREGVTWSDVTISDISFRQLPAGFICDSTGHTAYFQNRFEALNTLSMMNTGFLNYLTKIINPTVHFHIGYFNKLPFVQCEDVDLAKIAEDAIEISRQDWALHESSWEFQKFGLVACSGEKSLQESFDRFAHYCLDSRRRLKQLEEECNAAVLRAFHVNEEFSPEVPDAQITLYRPEREVDIKRLITYVIGCILGRYSLDTPGLIYAQSGNKNFDLGHYTTFPTDEDGIVPITEFAWFDEDAGNRFLKFITTAWDEKHLEDNLLFVADSLGPKRGESPRETVRRYLATGFYKHHLQMYKKRPIYWLFSSGKHRAFQCLVYLHRYNEGTLSRMRTEYVIPLQGMISSRIEQLDGDIAAATSTSHRKKLEKERDTLVKQRSELQEYDEKLRHYADQRISLDLDDGVKVNYAKFGDLLAEVKAVTGKKAGLWT